MATHIDVNILNMDKLRLEQSDILIYIPRVEEKSENSLRYLAQQIEHNNYHNNRDAINGHRQHHSNRTHEPAPAPDSGVCKGAHDDIYGKYDANCRGHNSTADMNRVKIIPKQDRNNNSKIIKVTIENIQTLPTTGKLEIILELPSGFQDTMHSNLAARVVEDQSTAHASTSPNESLPSQKKKNCTCRNLTGSLFDVKSTANSSHHLNIPKMRPRTHSDSKLQFMRPKIYKWPSLVSDRRAKMNGPELQNINVAVPEIKVQDFSDRRKDLQLCLKDESEDLRKDLIDNEDFVSQVNYYRKRANTCPEEILPKTLLTLRECNLTDRDGQKNKVNEWLLQQ